ncbi:MAG: serine/threonine protein kinase [Symploca sp. SIO2G7]|nr:serine/threonine protein kinase [Symploca sp. SIO2G7]
MTSATKTKLRDRYKTIKEILQQPNKQVYLVEDSQEYHKIYQLTKFFCQDTKTAQRTLKKFKFELENIKQPNNPQVQGLKDFFCVDQWFCLVQDYIEGESYETIKKKGEWNEYDIVAWLNQTLPVLSLLHRYNISHRNISPENIILVESKKLPVLINFGIGQEIEKYLKGETEQKQAANQQISEQCAQDLRDLAITALNLFSGKDSINLYNANTKQLQWEQIPLLTDRRQEVFSWILEEDSEQDSLTADAISQRLNTVLPPKMTLAIAPLVWKLLFWGIGGTILLFILGIGLVFLRNSISSSADNSPVFEVPEPQLNTGIEREIPAPEIPEEPQVELYHRNLIPVGSYNFYENALGKNVSYVREDDIMIGAVYNAQEPNIFTCFEATIGQYNVDVKWRRNLELIGRSGQSLNRSYSISTFTADNSMPIFGLDNTDAVRQCQNQFGQ